MDLSNKKVLITGGTGFLGKYVTAAFEKAGALVKSIGSEFDLRNPDAAYRAVTGQHVVIHLAAKVGGIGANRMSPGVFFYDNMLMGMNVIDVCRILNVEKLVVIGTCCSYPKHCSTPFMEDNLYAGYPEETNAAYGVAKRALFTMCEAYRQQFDLNAICLIPANLYGPGEHFDLEKSHVIPALIRKMDTALFNASDVNLWGDGSPTREFLYAEDCAKGIVLATEKYDECDPINLGTRDEISIRNLAELIAETVGFVGEIHWDKTKPNGQPRRCLDTSRALDRFDWKAETLLKDGISRTVEWYRANKESIIAAD